VKRASRSLSKQFIIKCLFKAKISFLLHLSFVIRGSSLINISLSLFFFELYSDYWWVKHESSFHFSDLLDLASVKRTNLWRKRIQGANFTNILRAAFLYESVLHIFSLITVWICNFLVKLYLQKSYLSNVVKWTKGCRRRYQSGRQPRQAARSRRQPQSKNKGSRIFLSYTLHCEDYSEKNNTNWHNLKNQWIPQGAAFRKGPFLSSTIPNNIMAMCPK